MKITVFFILLLSKSASICCFNHENNSFLRFRMEKNILFRKQRSILWKLPASSHHVDTLRRYGVIYRRKNEKQAYRCHQK